MLATKSYQSSKDFLLINNNNSAIREPIAGMVVELWLVSTGMHYGHAHVRIIESIFSAMKHGYAWKALA